MATHRIPAVPSVQVITVTGISLDGNVSLSRVGVDEDKCGSFPSCGSLSARYVGVGCARRDSSSVSLNLRGDGR